MPANPGKPYLKALICAAVTYAALAAFLVFEDAMNLSHKLVYCLGTCVVSAIVSGAICNSATKPCSWLKMILVYLLMLIIFAAARIFTDLSK